MNDVDVNDLDKDLIGINKSYCISLKSQENKWNDILNNIHQHGFPSCEIFEGIQGTSYKDADNSAILSVWQEYILKSESERHNHEHFASWGGLGCYMSHAAVWKDAIEKGYDKIAIFEDDVYFSSNFENTLKKDIIDVPKDWQLLLLDSYKLTTTPIIIDDKKTHVSKVDRFFGTHAYVITKECMIVLLSRILPIEIQIDSYMSFMIKLYNLHAYDIAGLCGQKLHISNIQTSCVSCPEVNTDTPNIPSLIYNHINNIIIVILVIIIFYLMSIK